MTRLVLILIFRTAKLKLISLKKDLFRLPANSMIQTLSTIPSFNLLATKSKFNIINSGKNNQEIKSVFSPFKITWIWLIRTSTHSALKHILK